MYSDSNENHAPRSSHRLETDDRSIDQYLDELIAGPFLLVLLVCVCVCGKLFQVRARRPVDVTGVTDSTRQISIRL